MTKGKEREREERDSERDFRVFCRSFAFSGARAVHRGQAHPAGEAILERRKRERERVLDGERKRRERPMEN